MKSLILSLFLFMSYSSLANICGGAGSLEQRLQDCAQKGFANTVYKDSEKTIFLDQTSGKLWTTLKASETFYNAIVKCQLIMDGMLSDQFEWRMAKTYELYQGFYSGIVRKLYRNYKSYWGLPGRKFWQQKAYAFEIMEDGKPYATGSYIKVGHSTGHERYLQRHAMCVGIPVRQ